MLAVKSQPSLHVLEHTFRILAHACSHACSELCPGNCCLPAAHPTSISEIYSKHVAFSNMWKEVSVVPYGRSPSKSSPFGYPAQ